MKDVVYATGLTCVVGATVVLGVTVLIFQPDPAKASAKFMQETGKACNFCHTAAPPQLNDQGKKFKANGNKL